MATRHYFLAAALPALKEAGSVPPLGLPELTAYVDDTSVSELVDVVVLCDDLLQREAYLQGERQEFRPAVLTRDQMRGEAPLPWAPAGATPPAAPVPPDVLWSSYFHYAAHVARRRSSAFLRRWIGWEVGLRNALTEARARLLELDPSTHTVAEDLAADEPDLGPLVREWELAPDPAAGHVVLLLGSWSWVERTRPWYTFEDDEFPAYAAKLVLLHRWQRIASGDGESQARSA